MIVEVVGQSVLIRIGLNVKGASEPEQWNTKDHNCNTERKQLLKSICQFDRI
jgi:hypothetical protein